jgi:hypothetical protein
MLNRAVLCSDRDATFPFQIHAVHDPVADLLACPVHTALTEHVVNKRSLSVIYVRDDRDVTNRFIPLLRAHGHSYR